MEAGKVYRVVTAQANDRTSSVANRGECPAVHAFPNGLHLVEIWKSGQAPEQMGCGNEEPAAGPMALQPPPGGSVFRIADIPPDPETTSKDEAAKMFEAMGDAHASTHSDDHGGALMHRTPSLDYGIVLEGEIILVLDDEEVPLKAGDVVIQRGSNHAWSNRSGAMCRMAFVMLDAQYA
ncbi:MULTISPECIES: cupin domain-containing protein [Sphingobium]|uniref:cupin domain-containing protein n=1 Tax=Sphingobium sp. MI1205 TaxID=407020 RepID=UPI0007702562|nr:cupin domain-containing protein [Sphingobium sp. MI1205]AMK19978.1 transcriptional regulator protein [Sphingobium sp. MI1205]